MTAVFQLLASGLAFKRLVNFLVGLVLAQGVHRPNSGWNPANHGDLQEQANDARERATNREESEPRKDQGYQQAHGLLAFMGGFIGEINPILLGRNIGRLIVYGRKFT
jgi:hypothetical protein